MNLGFLHGNKEIAYDSKFDVSLHEDKHYLVLDHGSAEIQEISDDSMLLCHSDIASNKLKTGDYIIGTGSGTYASDEESSGGLQIQNMSAHE